MKGQDELKFALYMANGIPFDMLMQRMRNEIATFEKRQDESSYDRMAATFLLMQFKWDIMQKGLEKAIEDNTYQDKMSQVVKTMHNFN